MAADAVDAGSSRSHTVGMAIRVLGPLDTTCPYRGLAAFAPADADEFFGRDADIDAILDRGGPGMLTVVVGASGSGKSSLVQAGVLPRLSPGRRAVIVTAGRNAAADLRERIAERGTVDVVVIDQAEDVFQLSEPDRDDLCELVARALAGGATVLMTLRSDFLDRAKGLPHIGGLVRAGLYAIGPLTEDGLRDAICRPAAQAGLRLERGLVEAIVRDAGDRRSTLPHVSHALVQTWVRREGSTLTVAGYEAAGGIAGAIAQSAETLYRSLDSAEAGSCRALLLRLVQRGPDGTSARRVVHLDPLIADATRRQVLGRLLAARLVVVDGDTVVVAHEAVAEAWPRLDAWLERDAAREPINASTAREQSELPVPTQPVAHERRSDLRLRWTLAGAAVLLVAALVSGGAAAVRGQDAAAVAEDRLIEAVTSSSLDLTGTNPPVAALMAVAAWQRRPDDVRTRSALLGTMVSAGGYYRTTYIPGTSQPIAAAPIPGTPTVAVVRDDDTLEIHDVDTGELLRTIDTDFPRSSQEVPPWVRVSADGSTIMVMQHVAEAPIPFDQDPDPDMARDETLYFFDIATGAPFGAPIHVPDRSETVELSSDGRWATWATTGATVIVDRDAQRTTRVTATTTAQPVPGASAYAVSAFRSDGRIVVTNLDDELFVIDPVSGAIVSTGGVPAGTGGVELAVAADGSIVTAGPTILAGLDQQGAVKWRTMPAVGDECSRIAASAVQRVFVCGSQRPTGRITIRSLDSGTLVSTPIDHQLGSPGEPVLTADESEVWFMGALSPSIGRMRLDGGGPASRSMGGPDAFALTGADPSARYVVTGSRAARDLSTDGSVPPLAVWDLRTRRETVDLTALTDPDPTRRRSSVVAAEWIGPHLLFLVFFDTQISDQNFALYDVESGVFARAVFEDPVEWFYRTAGGRLYGLVVLDPDAPHYRLVRYDPATLRPVGAALDVPGAPSTVSTTPDGSRVVVTGRTWEQRPWHTWVYDAAGRLVSEGLRDTTGSVVAGDRVIAADVSGVLQLDFALRPMSSLASRNAWSNELSTDDAGRTLLSTSGGHDGLTITALPSGRLLGEPIDVYLLSGRSTIDADGGGFVASGDRGVQYWTLDPVDHAAAACRIAGRELTREEWKTFLADLGPWHPLCEDVLSAPEAASTD